MEVVHNAQVYGLEESIQRAKYPMSVNTEEIISAEELHYWMENDFLSKFIQHQESGNYPHYIILSDGVEMQFETGESVYIDEEDVPKIFDKKWIIVKYCRNSDFGLMHRFLLKDYLADDESLIVDHIDQNVLNNRKSNLRLATKQQNGYNSKIRKNNKSAITGVSWDTSRNKWRAFINHNYKQIFIGRFDNFEDAVKARLIKEKELCGEFAPQKHLFEQYGIDTPQENSTVLPSHFKLADAIAAYKRLYSLSQSRPGEGHDQALTGIIVQFDLTFSVKAWTEAERYHFFDFVSSQSTMHRITKFDLDTAYMPYVDPRIIGIMKEKVKEYNAFSDENLKKEKYLEILYSNPCGFRLTAGMTTNYRQLKTIYHQRKNHRLPEWRAFCKWIETLPHAELITGEI